MSCPPDEVVHERKPSVTPLVVYATDNFGVPAVIVEQLELAAVLSGLRFPDQFFITEHGRSECGATIGHCTLTDGWWILDNSQILDM